MGRIKVKPGKPQSAVGMIAGILFVILGFSVVIPIFKGFGIIWTLFAVLITGYHAFNFFSADGAPTWEADIEPAPGDTDMAFDEKLRKLKQLKDEGLISEEEYQEKRSKIMSENW